MRDTKVLIFGRFPESRLAVLNGFGWSVKCIQSGTAKDLKAAVEIFGPEVLLIRTALVDENLLMAAHTLRLIVRLGAGHDNIDLHACAARTIAVATCPGKSASAVAELAFGLMLAIDRRVPDSVFALRQGHWRKGQYSTGKGLRSRTLGLIGLGHVGVEMVVRAKAFKMAIAT